MNGSVSGITKISIRSFSSGKKTNADNVEELRGESEEIQSAKENLTAQEVVGNHHTSNPEGVTENGEKPEYACCCSDSRSPVVVTSPAVSLYCQAYDSVGGKLVGCCLIASRKRLYRSSKKIAFMILCDSHRDRMRKHFCCPGCGLFCTQVRVFIRK